MSCLRELQRNSYHRDEHIKFLFKKSRRMRTLVSDPTMQKHFQGKLDAFRKILRAESPPGPPGPADCLGNFTSERHALRYYPEYEKPPDPETKLVCKYAVVAAIHDLVVGRLSMGDCLCNKKDDEWAETLSEGVVEVETSGDCETLEDRQEEIRIAFDDVAADLAKQAAEPRRKFSILGCIRKRLYHLVGATLGALVVAILIDIFVDLGWLEQIKTFVYRILQLK